MYRTILLAIIAILFALPEGLAAKQPPQQTAACVKVTLHEGSCILGTPNWETLDLETEFGEVQIPLRQLGEVKFDKGTHEVVAMLRNGDRLTGKLESPTLQLETIFGQVRLPKKYLVQLTTQTNLCYGNHHNIRFTSDDVRKLFIVPDATIWKVEGNEFVGQDRSHDKAGLLIYKTSFKSIDRVLIRGRVLPPRNQNFRVSVGPINLIFNWECANENHYRKDYELTRAPGHALSPGKLHDIVFKQEGADAVVFVDKREVFRAKAELKGTVSIYPACGSKIAIAELDIKGKPDPSVEVKGPSHTNNL